MNTIDAAKLSLTRAQDDHDTATKAHTDAIRAVDALRPTTDAPVGSDYHERRQQAEYAFLTTKAATVRTARTLAEATARLARLSEYAATLARLDKALALVAAKDDALSAECAAFYSRLAAGVAEIGATIAAADVEWAKLPQDLRAEIGLPTDRASAWGRATTDLLSRAAVVTYRRTGGFPAAKPAALRA